MTPREFFSRFPAQSSAWQVGSSLFFHRYEHSAREYATRTGQQCVEVHRSQQQNEAAPGASKKSADLGGKRK